MTNTKPLITINKLSKIYQTGENQTHALKGIDLEIYQGDYLSIQGPSGGGKSTLLAIIGLLDQASGGDYHISETSVTQLSANQMAQVRNKEIGFIFQDFNLIGDMTVSQNVELPLIHRGVDKKQRQALVKEVLARVNISSRAQHLPNQLSGGQQQRVAVARALVGKPTLLLADEPTGNLDSKNGDSVMQLLAELNEQGVTICMVTHDSRYAHFAKRTVKLLDGQIVNSPSVAQDTPADVSTTESYQVENANTDTSALTPEVS